MHEEKLLIGAKRKEVEVKVETVGMHQMCFELEGGKTPVRILFHIEYRPRSERFFSKYQRLILVMTYQGQFIQRRRLFS